MTKQAVLRNQAEDFVRKVLTETFGQKTNKEIIANTAAKLVRAVPGKSSKIHPTKEAISSSDQT